MSVQQAPALVAGEISRMSDQVRRLRIRGFLDREAREGDWWACVPLRSGDLYEKSSSGRYFPHPDLMQWARDLCQRLNARIHRDGIWCTGWFAPEPFEIKPQRHFALWKDPDGDIQFINEDEMPWADLQKVSVDHMVEQGQLMIQQWVKTMRNLDIDPRAQYKLAQGERPPGDPFMPDPITGQHSAGHPAAEGNGRFRTGRDRAGPPPGNGRTRNTSTR